MNIIDPANICTLTIDLHIGDEPSLFILLGADGTINRMGDGTPDCRKRQMCIGLGTPDVFVNVHKLVTTNMLEGCGRTYTGPNLSGATCKLTLIFRADNGTERQMCWIYGLRSAGPHPEVVALVTTAVKLTEVWYRRMVPSPKSTTPQRWWKRELSRWRSN